MKLSGVLIKEASKKSPAPAEGSPIELESPLDSNSSPKNGFTLLYGDGPSPQYLRKVFTKANQSGCEINLIIVTVPLYSFGPELAAKMASALDKANFLQAEHLRIANLAKDLRKDIINQLIAHYEESDDIKMVERLVSVTSNMNLNQLCASNPEIVDVIWDKNPHLAVISHLAEVEGFIDEVSTMYRGGNDCTIVNRHGKTPVVLPEICHRPILSIVRERAMEKSSNLAL